MEKMIVQATSGAIKTMVDNTLRITFDFEPKDAARAFKMFGERGTPAAIALITKEASISEMRKSEAEVKTLPKESEEKAINGLDENGKGPWGQYAASLYKTGFFYAPKVLEAIGTDKQYRQWIQTQPSAYSGDYSEWVNGDGRCIAAHVRRAGEAGTAYKPPYACIPLTDKEHQLQHQQGESALLGFNWDKARSEYLIKWVVEMLYVIFGVDSLTKIHPDDLSHWCEENDLGVYLPKMYREFKGAA